MGEAADDVLCGFCCQECGIIISLSRNPPGYPVSCRACASQPGSVVEQFRSAKSKHQRKRLTGPPHKTSAAPRKQLSKFGELRQCDGYHWQIRGSFGVLDWWPHKGKWRFAGQETEAGTFKEMLRQVEARNA